METLDGFYFDIETDGLYLQSSKIWYAKFKSLDGKRELALFPHNDKGAANKLMQWVGQYPDGCYVVSHNGLGFDLWALWKLMGIKPVVGKAGKDYLGGKHVTFIDTYVLSMYINPDSKGHSLEFLASGNENEKMDFRQKLIDQGLMDKAAPKGQEFSFFSESMIEYCDADVEAGIGVFNKLWADAKALYKDWVHPSFRQLSKDYFLYSAQAYTGVKFNVEKAKALLAHIDEKMAEIKAIVDPMLPSRELKSTEQAFYKIPAAPYKKNGDLSSTMIKWLEKHNAKIVDGKIEAYGMKVDIVANTVLPVKMPLEIDDNDELKNYFLESGWIPHEDFWNYKNDPATKKPMRDANGKLIKTSPKIKSDGELCPNLLKLNGEVPAKVVKYLSYRNRRGVVKGWINNWRIEWDGRLSAEISGYTPTFRVKHKTVTNCPKADAGVLLGSEMRDLFTVDNGCWYIGTDAAALENRTVAAYTMKYDNGAFADIVLNGDSHSRNAFIFFPDLKNRFDPCMKGLKDLPEFKPYRNKAKTGAYLLAYGGGVGRLSASLGLSKSEAKRAYDNYFLENEGLGKLKENIERYYNTVGKKSHVPAWDGRMLCARGKHTLINLIGQSCGSIAMSYAACFMDAWLGEMYLDDLGRPYYLYKGKKVKRVSMVHKCCAF